MSLFEIGHARAGRGRLFTWPSSEHSQVPLAHITSRYSCHQALASGAERVRVTEQRQSETERNETGTNDRNKAKSQNGEKACRSLQRLRICCVNLHVCHVFNSLQLSTAAPLAVAHKASAVCASHHADEPTYFSGE